MSLGEKISNAFQPRTYGPGGLCGASSFNGFQCDALNTAELYSETTSTTGSFTLAGSGSSGHMTTARGGATATLIKGSGTSLDGKVLITGGSTGSTFLALSTPPPGCAPFGQVAQNTAEIYDPVADSFTATGSIPGCTAGTTPPTCTTGLPKVENGRRGFICVINQEFIYDERQLCFLICTFSAARLCALS